VTPAAVIPIGAAEVAGELEDATVAVAETAPRRRRRRDSPAIRIVTTTVEGPARRVDLAMRMLAELLLRVGRVDSSVETRLSGADEPAMRAERRP
jgi:hypothetical protein